VSLLSPPHASAACLSRTNSAFALDGSWTCIRPLTDLHAPLACRYDDNYAEATAKQTNISKV